VQPFFVETAFNAALAAAKQTEYVGIHSKSLSVGEDEVCSHHLTPQNRQGFRVFSKITHAAKRQLRLSKD
jgi:hypothetical protein